VAAADWERVGEEYGFTGLVGRIRLRYDGEDGDPPASLVVKLPSARDVVPFERHLRELRFYREVDVPFAPRLCYGAADDEQHTSILLLEDLSAARQGDVLQGCSVDDAARVLGTVAPFHARWRDERSRSSGFPAFGRDPQRRQEQYGLKVDRFLAEHGASMPPGVCELVERLRSQLAGVFGALDARSRTLIHADLQLDNVLFDGRGDGSVIVLDWHTVSVGPAALDVGVFLVTSLAVEDRRAAEDDLLEEYVSLLAAHGARGCSVEGLRLECRLALLVLLAGTVGWLSTPRRGEQSGRERTLRHAALANGRLVAALADHDAGALLEGGGL
jgi:hypothetical protein